MCLCVDECVCVLKGLCREISNKFVTFVCVCVCVHVCVSKEISLDVTATINW